MNSNRNLRTATQCAVMGVFLMGLGSVAWAGDASTCSPWDPTCFFLKDGRGTTDQAVRIDPTKTFDDNKVGAGIEQLEALAGIEPARDYHTITTMSVECRDGRRAVMGSYPCDGAPNFFQRVEKLANEELALENSNYYRGLQTDFLSGMTEPASLPVCNLTENENDSATSFNPAQSCGEMCRIDVVTHWRLHGTVFRYADATVSDRNGACHREYGWYRGAFLQIENYFKEKVYDEFEKRNIQLVNYGAPGAHPCAAMAEDARRYLKAANQRVGSVITRLGEDAASKEKCDIQSNKTTEGSCALVSMNVNIEALWAQVLGCEIRFRAVKDFVLYLGDKASIQQQAKNIFGDKCGRAARNGGGGDGARSNRATDCYRREYTNYWKNLMERYKTNSKVELPPRTSSTSLPSTRGDGSPLFAGLGLAGLGSFARRRRRSLAGLAFLAGLLALISGSGCSRTRDHKDIPCEPCTGNGNCVYDTCRAAYRCTPVLLTGKRWESNDGGIVKPKDKTEAVVCVRGINDAGLLALQNIQADLNATLTDRANCHDVKTPQNTDLGPGYNVVTTCPTLDQRMNSIRSKIDGNMRIEASPPGCTQPVEVVCAQGRLRLARHWTLVNYDANCIKLEYPIFNADNYGTTVHYGGRDSCPPDQSIVGQGGGSTMVPHIFNAATAAVDFDGVETGLKETAKGGAPSGGGAGSAASVGTTSYEAPKIGPAGGGGGAAPKIAPLNTSFGSTPASGANAGLVKLDESPSERREGDAATSGTTLTGNGAEANNNIQFATTASKNGAGAKLGSSGSLFAARGASTSVGPQGSTTVMRLSTGRSSALQTNANDFEGYLGAVGKSGLSLFDIVSERLDQFGRDVVLP